MFLWFWSPLNFFHSLESKKSKTLHYKISFLKNFIYKINTVIAVIAPVALAKTSRISPSLFAVNKLWEISISTPKQNDAKKIFNKTDLILLFFKYKNQSITKTKWNVKCTNLSMPLTFMLSVGKLPVLTKHKRNTSRVQHNASTK